MCTSCFRGVASCDTIEGTKIQVCGPEEVGDRARAGIDLIWWHQESESEVNMSNTCLSMQVRRYLSVQAAQRCALR